MYEEKDELYDQFTDYRDKVQVLTGYIISAKKCMDEDNLNSAYIKLEKALKYVGEEI